MTLGLANIALVGAISNWLTPIWLLGVGALCGLLLYGIVVGIAWLISRRAGADLIETLREGVMLPIGYLALFVACFALLITFMVPYKDLLRATIQLPFSDEVPTQELEVPANANRYEMQIGLPAGRLKTVEIVSQGALQIGSPEREVRLQRVRLQMKAGEPFVWDRESSNRHLFLGENSTFLVTNETGRPVNITINSVIHTEFPETAVIPITALCLFALGALYVLLKLFAPKISAVALAASKEAIAQPIFYVVLALGGFALLAFVFIPYNTFGEDVKMVKDTGMTLIMLLAIVIALWTASVSVAEEIEGRTALTVLSKPIGRAQFVLGKFVGIIMPVALLFLLLGVLFLATVSYKVTYDAREAALPDPTWQQCYGEMINVVPGLVLAFMETVVLAAISIAISTRLPMLANLIICSSIYVMGHLLPMLVNSTVNDFEPVKFVGQFFATVLPVLDHFNVQAAVAAGAAVPLAYLGWALMYCVLYSSIAMLLALIMFEDRDLA